MGELSRDWIVDETAEYRMKGAIPATEVAIEIRLICRRPQAVITTNPAFVDTSNVYALINTRDEWHERAVQWQTRSQ
jgi:hypothetical protein